MTEHAEIEQCLSCTLLVASQRRVPRQPLTNCRGQWVTLMAGGHEGTVFAAGVCAKRLLLETWRVRLNMVGDALRLV